MAITIGLVNTKGGSGKSTLAINLACAWHQQGYRTLLVDADTQQRTAMKFALKGEQFETDIPPIVQLEGRLVETVPPMAAAFDVVVIDTPGWKASAITGAVALADIVLIPGAPDSKVIDEWPTTMEEVNKVLDARTSPPLIRAVMNSVDAGTVVSKSVREVYEAMGATVVESVIHRRVAVSEHHSAGMGITEYDRGKAALEMRELADEVATLAGLETAVKEVV